MFRYIMLSGLIILVVLGCGDNHPKQPEVHVYGALKNIMHKGDLSSKFSLNDLSGEEHVYALGAVENLKGEILIWDGKPYVSSKQGDSIAVDTTWDHEATVLVYSQVSDWYEIWIPGTIRMNHDQLGQIIDSMAIEKGLDIEQPFPFVLSGYFDKIDFHVIDWDADDPVHTHEKHKAAGYSGSLTGEAKLLGFYSRHHHAIFTHHSTNMHLHVMDPITGIYAHADEVEIGKFVTLGLPKVSSK